MKLIPKDQIGVPGVCILCEQTPVEGQEAVDTNRDLVTGFLFHLQGRKYVCTSCVKALGEVVGLVSNEKQQAAFMAQAVAEATLNAIKDNVAKLAAQLTETPYVHIAADIVPPVEPEPIAADVEVSDQAEPVPSPKAPAKDNAVEA